jgi:hypothetical protein
MHFGSPICAGAARLPPSYSRQSKGCFRSCNVYLQYSPVRASRRPDNPLVPLHSKPCNSTRESVKASTGSLCYRPWNGGSKFSAELDPEETCSESLSCPALCRSLPLSGIFQQRILGAFLPAFVTAIPVTQACAPAKKIQTGLRDVPSSTNRFSIPPRMAVCDPVT